MITPTLYKIITDLINNTQDKGSDIVSHIDQMNTDLASSEINEENINRKKLESQIAQTSDVLSNRHSEKTGLMLIFLFKLQKYIYDNYGSINNFLRDNNVQVLPVFAEMSGEVGYPIDAANIDNIS